VRNVEEAQVWKRLGKRNERSSLKTFSVGDETHDFSAPCIVIGGKNGAGKSRLLHSLASTLGQKGLFLDLHHLSEQAMILLRSRNDIEDMAQEAGLFTPNEERLEDLDRIIGRKYSFVEWSELDLTPSEDEVAETFKWGGDQATVPFFRVEHRGKTYTGRDMGLGEFTMHFLMWILEQYSSEGELTLLLDEPDAFLPPVGVKRLLQRLAWICVERGWQLILTTHSEEMIRTSVDRGAFVLVHVDEVGEPKVTSSRADRGIASPLLTRPSVERVLFCEDESAFYLIESMLRTVDKLEVGTVAVAWGGGHGYIRKLRDALPKPPRFGIGFAFVFDGDQWDAVDEDPSKWPSRFLPTALDPDALFRDALQIDTLADRVGVSRGNLEAFLAGIDGEENHDWVNQLAGHYGRVITLTALSDSWVNQHEEDATEFVEQLTSSQEFLIHSTQLAIKLAREEEEAQLRYAAESPEDK
jgi:hypothetical protein